MIAEAMEEAVRVGGDAGRRQRHQRAERGRLALQRHLLEKTPVHVGMEGGIILHQIVTARYRDRIGFSSQLEAYVRNHRHRGTDIDILRGGSKALPPDNQDDKG